MGEAIDRYRGNVYPRHVIYFGHATRRDVDGVLSCALMPLQTRSQRPQRQPESQRRKEYAWSFAFPPVLLIFYLSSDSDLTSKLVAARAELVTLQERYDALHADRDRLAQTLSECMKKWKRFRHYILTRKGKIPPELAEHDETCTCNCSLIPGLQQQSVIKMLETPMTPMSLCPLSFCHAPFADTHPEPRSNRAGAISSPIKAASPRKSPLSPNDSILPLISAQCSKIRISFEGSPCTRHLKRKRDENEDTTVEEMSQTQEDSQGSFFAFSHHAYNII